jgi:hypothetical protein
VKNLPCCFFQQQGIGVITMDMIGRIRRLHSRGKKSEREIARMTGLSRNTVARWLHGEVDGPPKYRRGEMPGKLKRINTPQQGSPQLSIDIRRFSRSMLVRLSNQLLMLAIRSR